MSNQSQRTGPYNGAAPKYINDFSKALAGEMRVLLAEVGQLRDERRQLQYEIAELMAMKSRHGSSGDYSHGDWRSSYTSTPSPPSIEAPPPPSSHVGTQSDDEPPVVARPAWRTVHKVGGRRQRALPAPRPQSPAPSHRPSPAHPPAPMPPHMHAPTPQTPAWMQWRPDPMLGPLPGIPPPEAGSPAPRAGLFGPPTPPPQ